jgi:hypothetical protein
MITEGGQDALPDPPDHEGNKFETARFIKALCGFDQAQVPPR